MVSREVRVERPDGTADSMPHVSHRLAREFGSPYMLRAFVPRPAAEATALEEDADEVYVSVGGEDIAGGLLRSVEGASGSVVELVVDSFEAYAEETEPVQPVRRENAGDGELVSEGLSFVDELSEGTVTSADNGLSFVFPHASPAKWIRTVASSSSNELLYNADKTVDFVGRVGEDRTSEVVLSAANNNIDGEIQPKEISRDTRYTHLRMLGPGEGTHQRQVNVVPDNDSDPYENRVDYSFGSWEQGDRKVWSAESNKDDTSVGSLESEGLSLMREAHDKHIEVEATVKGVDVGFGDTVRVEKPENRIDADLRVVEWERIDDQSGVRYECVLSTNARVRDTARTNASDLQRDRDRYNKAFEGSPVTMTAGGGRQPVNASNSYEFQFYYPDEVRYEHRVKLRVIGLPYRAYSQGAASNGGLHSHEFTVDIPDHDHGFSVNIPDHDHDVTYGVPQHSHIIPFELGAETELADGHRHGYDRPQNSTSVDVNEDETETTTSEDGGGYFESDTTDDGGGYFDSTTTRNEAGEHTHDPQPGILQFSEYPLDCDVLVNGASQGASLGDGSGPFQATVDLRGKLDPGRFNTVEVTSGSLGHIQANLDVDVYRQILGDG